MEFLKEALQYIVELREVKVQEINGQKYADKDLRRVSYNPKASPIKMNTLTSLIDYIKAEIDQMQEKMIVHVVSPTRVELYSMLDGERIREQMVEVIASVPCFPFGDYMNHENFCIGLQSEFVADESTDIALVMKFAGTVKDGTVAEYGDDGVTQKATVKTGITSSSDAVVPNPVHLKPYRTFVEIEQPESSFVFRMKSDRGVQCALFEADGGAWKNEAVKRVKEYLQTQLEGLEQFTVIS